MRSPLPLLLFLLFIVIPLKAQVVINEIEASNLSGLMDEDSEYSDWIELYNKSDVPVNMNGWGLSDDKAIPLKWVFPNLTLKPHGFVTVFASGKNRNELPLSWTTIINEGDNWKYYIPTSDIGTTWRNSDFSDTDWSTGPSGFGIGDDDDATNTGSIISLYVRKVFNVSDVEQVKRMLLHMDYDDGFVAYINGKEVARANIGTAGVDVSYNAVATDHEAQMYQGNDPELFDISSFTSYLVNGENVLAIEVHNNSAQSSDLTLIPFLTLGAESEAPVNNVADIISITSNSLHTNFKLSSEGESIYLYDSNSAFVDSLGQAIQYADVSYGANPDGSDQLGYFFPPTPGASNSNSELLGEPADSVVFSHSGGLIRADLSLILSSSKNGDLIYFTTDGTEPNSEDYLFSDVFSITKDTIVKARVFRAGHLPGPVVTQTFIRNHTHKLPVAALSTDPYNLYDYYNGIFVMGPNAQANDPFFDANFWMDWEKPFHFEYYTENGEQVVNQGVGAKIMGNYSRARDQKSLGLFARKSYGKGSFEYTFFKDKPEIKKFEGLAFRNGGNDWYYALFRDDFMCNLARGTEIDMQASQGVAMYLNGQYWGVYGMREKVNEHFLSSNHHVEADSIDLLEKNGDVLAGSNTQYWQMMNFITASNLQNADNYKKAKQMIDIDNFIQYELFQIYFDNTDWPGNNIKFWRPRTEDGQWRWIMFDTDFGFGLYYTENYKNNTLDFATSTAGPEWPNPAWSTLLLRRLLTSLEFKTDFITQYCDHLNTTFLPSAVNSCLDSMRRAYADEVQLHVQRWPGSAWNWSNEVNRIKQFSNNRPTYAWDYLKTKFGLGSKLSVSISVNDTKMGMVKLNSLKPRSTSFYGYYFKNVPIHLTAIPKPGYRFVRWEGTVLGDTPEITFDMSSLATFKAVFEVASPTDQVVSINEINYKSADSYDTGDWIELYNAGKTSVNLSGWKLSDNATDDPYIFKDGEMLYPGEYLVVCDKLEKFKSIHSSIKCAIGNFSFGFSSNGDVVKLIDANGNVVDVVEYRATYPWPIIAATSGSTLELNNPLNDNTKAENWKVLEGHGTPGKINNGYQVVEPVDTTEVTRMELLFYPSPFVDHATVELRAFDKDHYVIDVEDMNGRVIERILDANLENEIRKVEWGTAVGNPGGLANGIYFIRCRSNGGQKIIKVLKSN